MWKFSGNKSEKDTKKTKNTEKSTNVSSAIVKSDVINFPTPSGSGLGTTYSTTVEQRITARTVSESNFSKTTITSTSSSNSETSSGLSSNFSRDFTRHSFNTPNIYRDANPFLTYREVKNYSAVPRSAFSSQPLSNRLNPTGRSASTSVNPTNSRPPTNSLNLSSGRVTSKNGPEENNNVNLPAMEKLTVKVKGSTRWCDELGSKVPCYQTRSKKIVLLINIKNFTNNKAKERKGSEIDEKNLHTLFSEMGFKVKAPKRNEWTKKDVEKEISNFKSKGLNKYDICIVVVMSHGHGGIRSDSTVIECSNSQIIETNWIVTQFDGNNCKDLLGKPKIFVFQCCRGSQEYRKVATDGIASNASISPSSDILIAYATAPGYVSYRYEDIGSWYIYAFCKIFMDHACDTHVEDLLKMVDEMMKEFSDRHNDLTKPTTSYEVRGFKQCYLHPKMN